MRPLRPLLLLLLTIVPVPRARPPIRAGVPAEAPRDCLSRAPGSTGAPRLIGRDRLFFPDGPHGGWVSRFRGGDCPGAEPLSAVVEDQASGQPCTGDRVRLVNPGETIPGAICILGPFTRFVPSASARSRQR